MSKHATIANRHGIAAQLEPNREHAFRILQITDLHTDTGEETARATWNCVRELVLSCAPDLLAVTGDVWCGDENPTDAQRWFHRDLEFLAGLGVPWAFTRGNHDYFSDFSQAQDAIAQMPNAVVPPGDGRGNYRVEIVNTACGDARWDLFFLNSHARCLTSDDTRWLIEESRELSRIRQRICPAIAFFHIPLKQYEEARLAGDAVGPCDEEVSYWDDDGGRLADLCAAGNVQACFAGHSHNNDFFAIRDGVYLVYGRVTGHGGYGELKRGGKLLTLPMTADCFSFESVLFDGTTELRHEAQVRVARNLF